MRVLGPIGPASPARRERDRAVAAAGKGRGDANRRGDQVVLVEREGPHLQRQLDLAVGLDPKRDRGVGLDELGDQLQRAVAVEVLGGDADAHAVVRHLEDEAAMVRADRDLHLRRLEVAAIDGDLQARSFLRRAARDGADQRRRPQKDSAPDASIVHGALDRRPRDHQLVAGPGAGLDVGDRARADRRRADQRPEPPLLVPARRLAAQLDRRPRPAAGTAASACRSRRARRRARRARARSSRRARPATARRRDGQRRGRRARGVVRNAPVSAVR